MLVGRCAMLLPPVAAVDPPASGFASKEGRSDGRRHQLFAVLSLVAACLFATVPVSQFEMVSVNDTASLFKVMQKDSVSALRTAENWQTGTAYAVSCRPHARLETGPAPTRVAVLLPPVVVAAGGGPASSSAGSGSSCGGGGGGDGGGGGGGGSCPVPGCAWLSKAKKRASMSVLGHWRQKHRDLGPHHLYVPPEVHVEQCGVCDFPPMSRTEPEWMAQIADVAMEEYTTMELQHFESQATVQRSKDAMKRVCCCCC